MQQKCPLQPAPHTRPLCPATEARSIRWGAPSQDCSLTEASKPERSQHQMRFLRTLVARKSMEAGFALVNGHLVPILGSTSRRSGR